MAKRCAPRRSPGTSPAARERASYNSDMPVRLGIERLLDGPDRKLIEGKRVGLVCNPASIDSGIVHVSDRLLAAGHRLTALFGPQHGFRSDLQENMVESPHAHDAKRRVPVHSLYS